MLKRLNLQTESGEAVADVGYENERVIIKYYGEKSSQRKTNILMVIPLKMF